MGKSRRYPDVPECLQSSCELRAVELRYPKRVQRKCDLHPAVWLWPAVPEQEQVRRRGNRRLAVVINLRTAEWQSNHDYCAEHSCAIVCSVRQLVPKFNGAANQNPTYPPAVV